MRDPYEMKQVEYSGQKLSIVEIDNIPEYDIEDYDLMDTKDFNKYISNIERIVRGSFEYRQLIAFLRENMNMNKCSFYENVNNIDTFKIKIHIHHHPFTLYDICIMVYNKRTFYRESLDDEMVAKEVMFLHYNLMVGLIPLAETVHELVHNNYLFIPLDKVMGNYQQFINMYEDFMTPEQIDVLDRNMEFTKTFIEGSQNNILAKNYVYLDLTGAYEMPTIAEVINMMDEKIKQIQGKSIELVREEDKALKPLLRKKI